MVKDVIISYNNSCNELSRSFFQSCADEVRQIAVDRELTYQAITPPDLTSSKVEEAMNSCTEGVLFTAFSHGYPAGLINENGDDFVSTNVNNYLFWGHIFYTFSCEAGVELQKELTRNGAASFWGYNSKVNIMNHTEFIECATEGIKQLLCGKTIAEARQAMENKYFACHKKLKGLAAALLLENKESMIIIGEEHLTINDMPH